MAAIPMRGSHPETHQLMLVEEGGMEAWTSGARPLALPRDAVRYDTIR